MDAYCKGDKDSKNDVHLTKKLSRLEQQMKQLQQSLLDEKLKLNEERIGPVDRLPDNWVSMNRLHLPQCPLAKGAHSGLKKTNCPVHGPASRYKEPDRRWPADLPCRDIAVKQPDSDRYSQMIKENYSRLDSVNDKFRDLYDASMFSPTFYRPRPVSVEKSIEKDLDRTIYKVASGVSSASKNKSYESSLEDLCVTRNSSRTNTDSRSDAVSKGETQLSGSGSSREAFNPFIAIENVRKKFMDFENFVQEAYDKSKGDN